MRKIFAALLSVLGIGQSAAQPPAHSPEPITADLRAMVLNLSPDEIGLTPDNFPHRAWGVVMETGMDRGYYTLVVLADGTTSLYFSNGGGIIGAGERPEVRAASQQFKSPLDLGSTKHFHRTTDGWQHQVLLSDFRRRSILCRTGDRAGRGA